MTDNEKTLRRLLWLHHGCPHVALYGDDGEMQCNNQSCMVDFKRMPPEEIERIWSDPELTGVVSFEVGAIQAGPSDTPTQINSFEEFVEVFGTDDD